MCTSPAVSAASPPVPPDVASRHRLTCRGVPGRPHARGGACRVLSAPCATARLGRAVRYRRVPLIGLPAARDRFLRPSRGGRNPCTHPLPRVALCPPCGGRRFTRGYTRSPLRGSEGCGAAFRPPGGPSKGCRRAMPWSSATCRLRRGIYSPTMCLRRQWPRQSHAVADSARAWHPARGSRPELAPMPNRG